MVLNLMLNISVVDFIFIDNRFFNTKDMLVNSFVDSACVLIYF